MESIDACFGLVHKKAAGKYTFDPKLGSLKIVDDKEIDAFMSSYHATRTSNKVNANCLMFYNVDITISTYDNFFYNVDCRSNFSSILFYDGIIICCAT